LELGGDFALDQDSTRDQNAQLAASGMLNQRLRMEGWRQWQLGRRNNLVQRNTKTELTQTGLLMEGVYTTLRFSFAKIGIGIVAESEDWVFALSDCVH
jgi:hypothetical protein